MKLKSNQPKASAEQVVKDIRRATRRHYSTEDKIRIVLSGLRGEDSIAELCRKEGIAQGLYYSWSKEFLAHVRLMFDSRSTHVRLRFDQGSERWPRAVGQFLGIYKWVLRG